MTCTYENWPKSTKCIMCGHQREKDKGRNDKDSTTNMSLVLQSPERDLLHNNTQLGLSSPPYPPFIQLAQRDENLAIARR